MPTDPWRDQDVVHGPERAVGRQRFDFKHIEAGAAKSLLFQQLDHDRLVDNLAARNVDHHRVRLHRFKDAAIDHVMSLRRIRYQDNDDVGFRDRRFDLVTREYLVKVRHVGSARADANDAHAESLAARRQFLAVKADAEDGDGFAPQQLLWPFIPFRLRLIIQKTADFAEMRQHIEKGQFRHLRAVNAARRSDDDVLRQSERQQMVGAGGQRLDPAQLRHLVDHRRRYEMRHGRDCIAVLADGERFLLGMRDANRSLREFRGQDVPEILGVGVQKENIGLHRIGRPVSRKELRQC